MTKVKAVRGSDKYDNKALKIRRELTTVMSISSVVGGGVGEGRGGDADIKPFFHRDGCYN